MDSGSVYEHFRNRSLMTRETVDVYLADITRLGHAFVAGLPTAVKDKIKKSDHLSKLSLGETVARAHVFISDMPTHAPLLIYVATINHRSNGPLEIHNRRLGVSRIKSRFFHLKFKRRYGLTHVC